MTADEKKIATPQVIIFFVGQVLSSPTHHFLIVFEKPSSHDLVGVTSEGVLGVGESEGVEGGGKCACMCVCVCVCVCVCA